MLKRKTRKISLAVSMICLLAVLQVPVNAQEFFLDIANHEYEEDINRMYEEGYVQGVGHRQYNPDALLTNAQAVQLAVNVFDLNLDRFNFIKEPLATDYFIEADNEAWYAPAFIIAGANTIKVERTLVPAEPVTRQNFYHLFKLVEDSSMNAQDSLTRGQAANIIVKSLDSKSFEAFLDSEATPDAIEFIFDIHNQTESDQMITYSSGQTFDFNVYNSEGQHVYNWASTRSFIMMIQEVSIEKEAYVRYVTPWDYTDASGEKLPTGTYKVVFTSQFMFEEEQVQVSDEIIIDIP
jgi:hypothetical protein